MADFLEMKDMIIKRAEADMEFREAFKADPKGTIEKYFPSEDGKPIPQKLNFVVCEDNGTTIHFNISPPGFHPDCY